MDYPCKYCNKLFTDKSNKNRHEKKYCKNAHQIIVLHTPELKPKLKLKLKKDSIINKSINNQLIKDDDQSKKNERHMPNKYILPKHEIINNTKTNKLNELQEQMRIILSEIKLLDHQSSIDNSNLIINKPIKAPVYFHEYLDLYELCLPVMGEIKTINFLKSALGADKGCKYKWIFNLVKEGVICFENLPVKAKKIAKNKYELHINKSKGVIIIDKTGAEFENICNEIIIKTTLNFLKMQMDKCTALTTKYNTLRNNESSGSPQWHLWNDKTEKCIENMNGENFDRQQAHEQILGYSKKKPTQQYKLETYEKLPNIKNDDF